MPSSYGKNKEHKAIKEDSLINPLNPYAESKHKLEKFLLNLADNKKASCIILRYFNVAGADVKLRSGLAAKETNKIIKILCELVTKKRKKIIINGNNYDTTDGTPVRDFIHINDLSEMHLLTALDLFKNNQSEIYNCGYGKGYSVLELIKAMEVITKSKLNQEFGPRREGVIPYSVASTEKFDKKFNWKPKYQSLQSILTSALNWEKKYNL